MTARPRVLVTGPVGRADEYAVAAEGAGWQAVVLELIATRPLPLDEGALPERVDAVCVTSKNALAALERLPGRLREAPVAVVGEHTAERVRKAGFALLRDPARSAKELATALAGELAAGSHLLWLRGSLSDELAFELRARGFEVEAPVVYETVAAPTGSDDPDVASLAAAFFASPSAVHAFSERFVGASARRELAAIAIGPTTAAALLSSELECSKVLVLDRPAPDAFAARLAELAGASDR